MRFENKILKFFVEIGEFEAKSTEKNLLLFMSTAFILERLSGAKWGVFPENSIEVGER